MIDEEDDEFELPDEEEKDVSGELDEDDEV
jgi:hypothetical protein